MTSNIESTRVLIVDDSMIVRKAIRKAVIATGVQSSQIREAEHGADALEKLDDGPVDMLFLDINMPVMNGEELMEKLDEEERATDQYIVVVSTEVNAKRLLKMATLGARARLHKPFEPERLRALIFDAAKEREAA